MKHVKIRLRSLLLAVVLIAIIPSTAFSYFIYQDELNQRRDLTLRRHLETADAVAVAVNAFLLDSVKTEIAAGLALTDTPLKPVQKKRLLESVLTIDKQFQSLALLKTDGQPEVFTGDQAPHSPPAGTLDKLQSGDNWLVTDLENVGDELHFHIITAIKREGRLDGFVDAVVTDTTINKLVDIQIGEKGNIGVIDGTGRAVTLTFAPKLDFDKRWRGFIKSIKSALKGKRSTVESFHDPIGGVDRMGASVPIGKTGWVANVFQPTDEVLRPIQIVSLRLAAGIFLSGLLSLLIIFFVALRVTGTLNELVERVKTIGGGKLDTRLPVSSGISEVAQLAESFNSMAGEVKHRFEVEKHIAQNLQKGLLPGNIPDLPGFKIQSRYASATREAVVGGDFYDFISITDDLVAVVIGDVAGKGVEVATMTAVVKFLLRDIVNRVYRSESPQADPARIPALVLNSLNESLVHEFEPEQFITLFFGIINLSDAAIYFANAGHPQALVCNPETSKCLQFKGTNLILGVESDFKYESGRAQLQPGDTLALYTDGIIETRDASGRFFGEEGLADSLLADKGFKDKAEQIYVDCLEFAGGRISDDFTIILIRRND